MTGTPSTSAPVTTGLRLAVVEDDDELRERILLPALRTAGFEALGFSSALDLYREWMRAPFALVLLDVGLPDEDGVDIALHLRTLASSVGIVICSAHGRGTDRMRGLRAGADAYLVKPLETDEVVETLRNLARRLSAGDLSATAGSGWSLAQRGWALVTPARTSIALSRNERAVMTVLAQCPGETVPREALAMHLTCDAADFDPHRLEMLVYRLRRKCEAAGHPLALATVRGVGYRLDW